MQDARAQLERFRKADAFIDLGAGGLTGSPGALKLTPDESERALETMRHLVEQQIEDYLTAHPASEE
ncbi:hypothetical protein [Sinomonas sp. RB5]